MITAKFNQPVESGSCPSAVIDVSASSGWGKAEVRQISGGKGVWWRILESFNADTGTVRVKS